MVEEKEDMKPESYSVEEYESEIKVKMAKYEAEMAKMVNEKVRKSNLEPAPVKEADPDAGKVEKIAGMLSSGASLEMQAALALILQMSSDKSYEKAGAVWESWGKAVEKGLALSGDSREEFAREFSLAYPEAKDLVVFYDPNDDVNVFMGSALDRAVFMGLQAQCSFWIKACGPDWNPDALSTGLVWALRRFGVGKNDAKASAAMVDLFLDNGASPSSAPRPGLIEASPRGAAGEIPNLTKLADSVMAPFLAKDGEAERALRARMEDPATSRQFLLNASMRLALSAASGGPLTLTDQERSEVLSRVGAQMAYRAVRKNQIHGLIDKVGARQALERLLSERSARPAKDTADIFVDARSPLALALEARQPMVACRLLMAGADPSEASMGLLRDARAAITEASRQAVMDSVSKRMGSNDLEQARSACSAVFSLYRCGWTREADFEGFSAALGLAKKKHGDALGRALAGSSELSESYAFKFTPGSMTHVAEGSEMDQAIGAGEHGALAFFIQAVGPDWRPGPAKIREGLKFFCYATKTETERPELVSPLRQAVLMGDEEAIGMLARSGASREDGSMRLWLDALAVSDRGVMAALLMAGLDTESLSAEKRSEVGASFGPQERLAMLESALNELSSFEPERAASSGARLLKTCKDLGWIDDPALVSSRVVELLLAKRDLPASVDEFIEEGSVAPETMALLGEERPEWFWRNVGKARWRSEKNEGAVHGSIEGSGAVAAYARFRWAMENGEIGLAAQEIKTSAVLSKTLSEREEMGRWAFKAAQPGGSELLKTMLEAHWPLKELLSSGSGSEPWTSASTASPLVEAMEASVKAGDQSQVERLMALLPSEALPAPDEAALSRLFPADSMEPAIMGGLLKASQGLFWRFQGALRWSQDTAELSAAALESGAAGMGSYVRLRSALARDDVGSACAEIEKTPALLSSLSSHGLLEGVVLEALKPGRSKLLGAMSDQGWPLEAVLRSRVVEAIVATTQARDSAMLDKLLPLMPADASLGVSDHETLLRSCWKLGGAPLAQRCADALGGFDPKALERCGGLLGGVEGARFISSQIGDSLEREAGRSGALEAQQVVAARRQERLGMLFTHWGALSEEQCLRSALAVARWSAPPYDWGRAARELRNANPEQLSAGAQGGGTLGFHFYSLGLASYQEMALACGPSSRKELARAAQMAAAVSDDPELARSASGAGMGVDEQALLASARRGSARCFAALLSQCDAGALDGMLSKALLPDGSPGSKEAFETPEARGLDLPPWAAVDLVKQGASFKLPLSESDAARLGSLRGLCVIDGLSAEREKTLALLCLLGALPPTQGLWKGLWDSKSEIFKRDPSLLEQAGLEDRNNPEMVAAAVEADGLALRYAGPVPRAALSIVQKACAQNPDAALFIHPMLAKGLNITVDNAQAKLLAALEDASSLNPLKFFARRAINMLEKNAQEAAGEEVAARARSRGIDFSKLERSLAKFEKESLGSVASESALAQGARKALGAARSIAQSLADHEIFSGVDVADMRRLVEKNMPDALEGYMRTEAKSRAVYDPVTRSNPHDMLGKALRDAQTCMVGVVGRLEEGARVGLLGEVEVLGAKASGAVESQARALEASRAIQVEMGGSEPVARALSAFQSSVEASGSAATWVASPPKAGANAPSVA